MDVLEQVANGIQALEQEHIRIENNLNDLKQIFQGYLTTQATHVNTLYSRLQGVSVPPGASQAADPQSGPSVADPTQNPTFTPATSVTAVAPQQPLDANTGSNNPVAQPVFSTPQQNVDPITGLPVNPTQ